MERRNIILVSMFLSALFLVTILHAQEERWCPLCGMNLKMYWKTNNRLLLSDGSKVQTCSLHCAAQIYSKRAAEIDKWEIVDYHTDKFIDARKAHFLIGSDLPGVMTAVSKKAFESIEVAREYQKKHGGTIGTFDEALKRTLDDMGEDNKMIMKKVAEMVKAGEGLAGKHGCYNCHGEGGKGGKAPAWNSPDFIQRMDTRVKIKKAIMEGGKGMPFFEGKIPEKELHAITLYIWTLRGK